MDGDLDPSDSVSSALPALGFFSLGVVVLWRSGSYRIGWLMGATGLSTFRADVTGDLADAGLAAFSRTSDVERGMERFSPSLRDEVDPDEVVRGWVAAVSETMHPNALGVWVRV